MSDLPDRDLGAEAMRDRTRSGRPNPVLRKVAGPLVLYHIFLLVGAALLLRGDVLGSVPLLDSGAALIVGGVALEVAILSWAAGLIRAGARSGPVRSVASSDASTSSSVGRWLCVGCGWRSDLAHGSCPRCGKLTVRFASSSPPRPNC